MRFRVEASDMPHRIDDIGCDGRHFVMISNRAGGEPETVVVLKWINSLIDTVRAADSAH